MFTDRILFRTIPNGLHAGWLNYSVILSGDPPLEDELYDTILTITNHKSPIPYVTLEGQLTDENATGCLTLAKTLSDMGYSLRVVTPGDVYFSWFALVKHLLVKVDTAKWAMFNVGELHYIMTNAQDPVPYLPPNRNIPKYIDPDVSVPAEEVLDFIKRAPEAWAVLLRTKKNFTEVLKDG